MISWWLIFFVFGLLGAFSVVTQRDSVLVRHK